MSKETIPMLFIGAGNMSKAIIFPMIDKLNYKPSDITVFDNVKSQYAEFEKKGVSIATDLCEAIKDADTILFAVKPQNMSSLLDDIKNMNVDLSGKLFITICASITIDFICGKLGSELPVIRIMPNTALMSGEGMCAVTKNKYVSHADFDKICGVFKAIGEIIVLEETDMNNIIPVNASSPAVVYKMIGAFMKGSEKFGFSAEEMYPVVLKVFKGALKMMEESGKTPGELISMVSSKKGTTEKMLETLDHHNFDEMIAEAMNNCAERADELTKEICTE